MEDKIRRLCSELLAPGGDEKVARITVELRNALHQYIEGVRARLGAYPYFLERRSRQDMVLGDQAHEANQTRAERES